MAIRKTESRFPDGLLAADLGQAVAAPDGRCTLISFVTSPLANHRSNVYVVFVTDAGLAAAAASYEWTVTENGGTPVIQTTPLGEFKYTAQAVGHVVIAVRILDGASAEQATLSITQDIVAANPELENLIKDAVNHPGPGTASPDVLRELINEHNLYYQAVAPQTAEAGDGYKRMVFNMVYDGALQRPAVDRKNFLDMLALSLNTGETDFATLSGQRNGVSGIRLLLLAMTIPGMLPFTLLPADASQRQVVDEQLRQTLAQLDENKRIDLFNIIRFPKSNIVFCGRILETLRDRYFSGTNFNDVLTGMSGARAQWIITQYQQGPVVRT